MAATVAMIATTITNSKSEKAQVLRKRIAGTISGADRAQEEIDARPVEGKANRYFGSAAGEVVGMGGFNRAGGGVPGIRSDMAAMDVP